MAGRLGHPVFARQENLSGSVTGKPQYLLVGWCLLSVLGMTSLNNTLLQLRCHYSDQVFINGSSTGVRVCVSHYPYHTVSPVATSAVILMQVLSRYWL